MRLVVELGVTILLVLLVGAMTIATAALADSIPDTVRRAFASLVFAALLGERFLKWMNR